MIYIPFSLPLLFIFWRNSWRIVGLHSLSFLLLQNLDRPERKVSTRHNDSKSLPSPLPTSPPLSESPPWRAFNGLLSVGSLLGSVLFGFCPSDWSPTLSVEPGLSLKLGVWLIYQAWLAIFSASPFFPSECRKASAAFESWNSVASLAAWLWGSDLISVLLCTYSSVKWA